MCEKRHKCHKLPKYKPEKSAPKSENNSVGKTEKTEAAHMFGFSSNKQKHMSKLSGGGAQEQQVPGTSTNLAGPIRKLRLRAGGETTPKTDDSGYNPFAVDAAAGTDDGDEHYNPFGAGGYVPNVVSNVPSEFDVAAAAASPEDVSALEVNGGDKKQRRAQRKKLRSVAKQSRHQRCMEQIPEHCLMCSYDYDSVHSWKQLRDANARSVDKSACMMCVYELKTLICN